MCVRLHQVTMVSNYLIFVTSVQMYSRHLLYSIRVCCPRRDSIRIMCCILWSLLCFQYWMWGDYICQQLLCHCLHILHLHWSRSMHLHILQDKLQRLQVEDWLWHLGVGGSLWSLKHCCCHRWTQGDWLWIWHSDHHQSWWNFSPHHMWIQLWSTHLCTS